MHARVLRAIGIACTNSSAFGAHKAAVACIRAMVGLSARIQSTEISLLSPLP